MGSGKKNKHGGAPKQKGRLQSALAESLSATAARQRALVAKQSAEDRVKSSALNAATGGGKKRRKMVEREKQRAAGVKAADAAGDDEDEDAEMELDVDESATAEKKPLRPRKQGTVPYKVGEKVLLVGEGNFSFAHALILATPPIISPHLLLATAYDTLEVAQSKYPDLMEHVDAIKAAGVRVVFGVDCTTLAKYRDVKDGAGSAGWDKVVFNFPHVGLGITDQDRNVRANQTLLLKFLRSVSPLLATGATSTIAHIKRKIIAPGKRPPSTKANSKRPRRPESDDEEDAPVDDGPIGSDPEDEPLAFLTPAAEGVKVAGTVLITLRTDAPYSLWHVQALATRGPLLAPSILPRPLPSGEQPTYKVVRSFEFDARDYEGYEHRRTVGWKEGVSSAANDDLRLSARERGEKRDAGSDKAERKAAGEQRRDDKERGDREKSGREKKGAVRTWELECVPLKDVDDAYD